MRRSGSTPDGTFQNIGNTRVFHKMAECLIGTLSLDLTHHMLQVAAATSSPVPTT